MSSQFNYLTHILCPKHHKQIKWMNIAPNQEDRVMCQECPIHESQEINEVLTRWQETQKDEKKYIKSQTIEVKKSLIDILNQFETFKKHIVESINNLICEVKQLLSIVQRISDHRIKDFNQYLTFSKLNEIAEQMSKPEQQNNEQAYQEMVENLEQQIQDQTFFLEKVNYQIQLLKYNKQNIQQEFLIGSLTQIEPTAITYEIISEVYHREQCRAIAFSNSGVMITGFGDYIKVFEESEEQHKLMGHSNTVNCLAYSQNTDMFLSGSSDQTIKVWRKQNDEWVYIDLGKHNDFVVGLLLNHDDDQIISCSHDSTIKIWNYENEEWIYTQSLTNHRDAVNCISFNQSQTQLVSCGMDAQIIIWEIGESKCWNLRQILKNDSFGFRVAFVNDDQIAWQPKLTGITKIYELDNTDGLFKEQENLKIQLKKEYQDNWLFPTIFNSEKQIIVQKHNKFIYIISKKDDYQWKVMQIIEMSHHNTYGNLSNDGQYLGLWDSHTRLLKIYKIYD